MPRKQDYVDGWLFADNQRFTNHEIDLPVNHNEMLEGMKRRYGVVDIPVIARVTICIMLFVFGIVMINVALLQMAKITSSMVEFVINALYALSLMCLGIYVLIPIMFLLLPQRHKMQAAWEKLVTTGTIIEGQITDKKYLRGLQDSEYSYEFYNAQNKRIKGKYVCRTLPLLITHQTINFDYSQSHRPHPKPKHVKVWYADDKVHTLL